MADLKMLFDAAVETYEEMDKMLLSLPLTTKQYLIVKSTLSQFLPTRMIVRQRTPKGTTWFDVKDRWRVKIDGRGLPRIVGR